MDSKEIAKAVAKSIFYSSIIASIGSVEMSSKFSVMNFSKDQQTLQRAADALKSFIIVGAIWSIGTCDVFITRSIGIVVGYDIISHHDGLDYFELYQSFSSSC